MHTDAGLFTTTAAAAAATTTTTAIKGVTGPHRGGARRAASCPTRSLYTSSSWRAQPGKQARLTS